MKRVTNIYDESLPLPLVTPTGPTVDQLARGKHKDLEDDQIGEELKLLEKKKRVTIIDTKDIVEPRVVPSKKIDRKALDKKRAESQPIENNNIISSAIPSGTDEKKLGELLKKHKKDSE